MSNVGYATLSVIPSMQGIEPILSGGLRHSFTGAGQEAGGMFGGAFGGALGGVLAGGAVVAGVGAGLAAIGSSFDDAFDNIRIKTGATGRELGGLKDVFRDVVSDVPTDFGSASTAVAGLSQRLHLQGGDLTGLSEQMLEASRITETDLAGNVNTVTRAFGDWGITTDDMGERLDQFFRASQLGGTSISDLATNVTNFGSPLRQLGFSLDDSLAMFARFEAEGVNTSTVMSGMRQAVKNFGSGLAQERAGVSNFQDVVAGVKDGTFDLTDAMTVFGARAGTDVFKAIQEGRFELGRFGQEISNGSDTIMGAAADTNDWRESLETLKNRALVFIEPLATRVFDALGQGAGILVEISDAFGEGGLAGVLDLLKDRLAGIPTPVKVIGAALFAILNPLGAVAAGAVYAYTHFDGFRHVVDGVVRWLVGTAWPALQTFARGVADTFGDAVAWVQSRWPAIQEAVGHVLTVVRAVIGGWVIWAKTVWHAWGDDIVNFARAAWSYISSTIRNALQLVRGIIDTVLAVINGDWGKAWDGIKTILSAVWHQMLAGLRLGWAALKGVFGAGISALKTLWRAGWTAVKAVLSAAWQAILGAIRGALANARSAMSSAWNAMRSSVRSAWAGIRSLVRTGIDTVVGFVRSLPGRVAALADGAWDSLVDGFRSAINTIIDFWNGLEFSIPGFDPPGPGPTFGGLTVGTPDIPHLAEGGTLTRGGTVLVGEVAPELLDLPAGARVTPLTSAGVASRDPLELVLRLEGSDKELLKLIRKWIRVEGGDVQAVLGT